MPASRRLRPLLHAFNAGDLRAAALDRGFVPTLQPLSDFGRLYAVYGGLFIAMSYGWGYVFDGMKPDLGDLIGSILALLGVCIALFWPRSASR